MGGVVKGEILVTEDEELGVVLQGWCGFQVWIEGVDVGVG